MKVIALRQLHGSYGTKLTGEEFEVTDTIGSKLLARRLVTPAPTYQTKVTPPEAPHVGIEHHELKPANKRK